MNSSNLNDKAMFLVSWKPIVAAMTFAFSNFNDDSMVQRTILGFNQCAILAAEYEMIEVFDYLIESLSLISELRVTKATDFNNLITISSPKVTISPISINLGSNLKSQLSLVILFTIANNNSNKLSNSWKYVWKIIITLFNHNLLPIGLLQLEDFLSGESVIPLKPINTAPAVTNTRSDTGLLSTLSSYLLSPYSSTPEQSIIDYTDDDIETTLSAIDCITLCKIDELYSQIL